MAKAESPKEHEDVAVDDPRTDEEVGTNSDAIQVPDVEVFLTVDLEGNYWWATRDDDGELTKSDGPYPDRNTVEERARDAFTPDPPLPPNITFTIEEDQRIAEAPS